jgi:hypothetical protein
MKNDNADDIRQEEKERKKKRKTTKKTDKTKIPLGLEDVVPPHR